MNEELERSRNKKSYVVRCREDRPAGGRLCAISSDGQRDPVCFSIPSLSENEGENHEAIFSRPKIVEEIVGRSFTDHSLPGDFGMGILLQSFQSKVSH